MSPSTSTLRHDLPASGENRLLAALPPDEYARILDQAELKSLKLRDILHRAGGPLEHVYFARSGVLSRILIMLDGRAAEVSLVGNMGMVGLTAYLGADTCLTHVICQIPAEVLRVPALAFATEVRRAGRLQEIVYRYTRVVVNTTSILCACNCLHSIEERCARWILMSWDRAGTDEFPLTQEFLAVMLGVHRPSVTLVAGALQNAGLISYRHGRVTVLDRERLEEVSCECYRTIRDDFDRLLI
ncbi:transcriptional regulator, Crp/Fnr family [Singulisphaera sp. GP187]|uniref:Crp/Fnr family transcriptional regulator n=1 Tax=Singulisphaera sp. GP187 TaxID=1882752 RepID=UPI00092ABFED|nr:Crp/Fnr family transcriptional regulator [Singulisphaera sp. GP187]SIO44263.1 transcriptional regulator, Crp/Fnr family [Singulisphaera sp. GP187]